MGAVAIKGRSRVAGFIWESFALSLSKGCSSLLLRAVKEKEQPFDKLRANGGGEGALF